MAALRSQLKGVPLRTVKITTISALAMVLLAGASIAVVAQDDETTPMATSFTGTRAAE